MVLRGFIINNESVLNIIYNIFVVMESETNDIERYLKKVDAPLTADDLFDGIDKIKKSIK